MKRNLKDLEASVRSLSPEKRALLNRRVREASVRPVAPRLSRVPHDGRAPLSYSQLMLWGWQKWHPDEPQLNWVTGLHLRGPLDVDALTRAVDAVLRRNETLRTRFEVIDGEPMQILSPAPASGLERIDHVGLSVEEALGKAHAFLAGEYHRTTDLIRGPVVRFILQRIAEREHLLGLVAHRIVLDPAFFGPVLGELLVIYDAFARGDASPLPELTIQFADYAVWQRQLLATEPFQKRIADRRRAIVGAKPVPLPYDRPPPPPEAGLVRSQDVLGEQVPISSALLKEIDSLAASESSTRFPLLLAAFKAFLFCITKETDIVVVGPSEMARGLAPELASLPARLVDQFVLRTDLSGDPTFRELIRREKAVVQVAYQNADIPGGLILQTESPIDSPLARVLCNFIDAVQVPMREAELSAELVSIRGKRELHRFADFGWVVFLGDPVFSILTGVADGFDAATITRLARLQSKVLERVIAKPETHLSELSRL